MKKKLRGFVIKRETLFNGKRKVGVDTNVLIKIYKDPGLFDYEESRIFNYQDLVFTHSICVLELAKFIKKLENIDFERAMMEAKEFVKRHNIIRIFPKDCYVHVKRHNIIRIFPKDCYVQQEEIDKFQKDVNQYFQKNQINSECHPPDSIIVLAFKKWGINKIISTDLGFRESAKFLGIGGTSLPSLNSVISRKLRSLYNNKRKKFKKRR